MQEVSLSIRRCDTSDIFVVMVAADTLYFTGGKYTFRGGDTDSIGILCARWRCSWYLLTVVEEQRLYSIPLNNSFPVDGPLPSNNYVQTYSPKQWGAQGAFFQNADETMLYSFGGYIDAKQPPHNALNAYNISSGEWSNITVSGGNYNYDPRGASSHSISTGSSEALGFVTGGWDDLGGMIRFNASDPANPQWRNETNNNPPLSLEGGMEFIRLGPRGSLINFGGYNKDYVNTKLKGWSYDRRPMDQINAYDIDSATWYNVTASGDVPSDRSAFCTVVSSAPDDSSFQITMYAGWDLFAGHSFADTYVLSIPSFQWINVTDSSNLDARISSGNGISGRDHHQCAAYKERQMLILGGILRTGGDSINRSGCKKNLPAMRAIDLSTFKFKDTWNGSPEPYFVPDAVTRIIGGTGRGGATMKQPNGGFNDSALNTVFAQVAAKYTPPVIAAASNNAASGKTPPSPTTQSLNVGAIAGGVVGGIAVLAGIAALFLFFLRRRKRTANANANVPPYSQDEAGNGIGNSKPPGTSSELQSHPVASGEYYKPPLAVPGRGPRSYEPVSQEMDGGHRLSELHGSTNGDGRRPLSELPEYADGHDRRHVGELPG